MSKKPFIPKYVKRIFYSEKQVNQKVAQAAEWLNKKFKNNKKPPIFLCVLKGALPFYGKLIMQIKMDVIFDFIVLSSFRGNIKAVGMPKIVTDLFNDIKGRDVVIIEDVSDSAKTLTVLIKYLKSRKPKSLTTVVLVDKPDMRKVSFKPDYACLTIKNNPFLVGCGLDINEKARNLPYIGEFDKRYLGKV